MELSARQIRAHRLRAHHLDQKYPFGELLTVAGTCGLQNSPPGAWETALYNRLQNPDPVWLQSLLSQENLLVQAWSIRGVPMIFPLEDSPVFLSALIPTEGEPWIYTRGITGSGLSGHILSTGPGLAAPGNCGPGFPLPCQQNRS